MLIPGLLLLCALQVAATAGQEEFSERLLLRPLHDGKLSTFFEFTTRVRNAEPRDPLITGLENDPLHLNLLPLSLAQILQTYAVSELHLSLNSGKWDYARWGYPDNPAVRTGAELWAWIGQGGTETVSQRWQGITNSLAGLLCASLGGLDEKRTVSPKHAFRTEGSLLSHTPHHLFHAALPSEAVCTENLTPFLKLLPCKSSAGIATLLNPHRVFDADWHGMGVDVLWQNANETISGSSETVVRLTFQAVFDPVRFSGDAHKRDWSFRSVFDRAVSRVCPAATSSSVDVISLSDAASLSPEPSLSSVHRGEGVLSYDLTSLQGVHHGEFNLAMTWPESRFEYSSTIPLPDLFARRTLKGSDQSSGKLSVTITNSAAVPRTILYVETLPWFINLFLHTLEAKVDGVAQPSLIKSFSYVPTISSHPTVLEAKLEIPANSTIFLTLAVQKSYIRYTEHPPDASRGWDLPAAVIIPLDDVPPARLYTQTLLVDLATPDFSMPYNVIIMSSTLIALFFGSVFNLLTRRFVTFKMDDKEKEKAG